MKKLILLSFLLIALTGAGCQPKNKLNSSTQTNSKPAAVDVVESEISENTAVETENKVVNNETPTSSNVATEKTSPNNLTWAEVQAANNSSKCWVVIRGVVYDLTSFITKHPGGANNILKLCGTDGTAAFEKKHGGQDKPEQALLNFPIGKLE